MKSTIGQPLVTRARLVADLRRLGVSQGNTLLVHSSLRSFGGWVCGGATTVVAALLEAVGPKGTLVVPAQSPECQDPSRWSHLRVPEEWLAEVRDTVPSFDPALTPTDSGAIAERVRTWPGAHRSPHPLTSFAGLGPAAATLLAEHELASLLGEGSPLAGLEALGAKILLLGVGWNRCTAMHLAEYRLPDLRHRVASCVIRTPDQHREWISFETVQLDASDFPLIGEDLEASVDWVRAGQVANARARLVPVRETVRFAHRWMLRHRAASPIPESASVPEASSPKVGEPIR